MLHANSTTQNTWWLLTVGLACGKRGSWCVCPVQRTQLALVAALVALAYLYFIMYFVYMKRAKNRLGHESYAKYK